MPGLMLESVSVALSTTIVMVSSSSADASSGSVLIDSWSQNRRRRSRRRDTYRRSTCSRRPSATVPPHVSTASKHIRQTVKPGVVGHGEADPAVQTERPASPTTRVGVAGGEWRGWRRSYCSMPHAGTWRARPLHATAPLAAAARTTTRPSRGRDPQPARVAATSPASASADASSHPRTGERWRWASSVPRPRATSRAPRARAKVLVDARPASVPTQGRNGSVGAAKATTPRAVRTHASTCTAWSLRRSESASTPSS